MGRAFCIIGKRKDGPEEDRLHYSAPLTFFSLSSELFSDLSL